MEIRLEEVKGNLLKKLPRATEIAERALSQGLNEASGALWERAKDTTPTATGTLAKSIRRDLTPTYAKIYPELKYGLYVHEGTKPHWIPKAELEPGGSLYRWFLKKGIKDKRHQYAIVRSIARKGTKGNPWFARAVEEKEKDVVRIFREAADKLVASLAN